MEKATSKEIADQLNKSWCSSMYRESYNPAKVQEMTRQVSVSSSMSSSRCNSLAASATNSGIGSILEDSTNVSANPGVLKRRKSSNYQMDFVDPKTFNVAVEKPRRKSQLGEESLALHQMFHEDDKGTFKTSYSAQFVPPAEQIPGGGDARSLNSSAGDPQDLNASAYGRPIVPKAMKYFKPVAT